MKPLLRFRRFSLASKSSASSSRAAHFFVGQEVRKASAALDLFNKFSLFTSHGPPCTR
jgi:hypothetical protein